jgi:diaminopimelate epimerase
MHGLSFEKYQATGNDFVMIDNRQQVVATDAYGLFEAMCHRRFGIGADGVILLDTVDGYDFEMYYYNSDGRPSTMCGNGGRCVARFAQHLGLVASEGHFLAVDGPHKAKLTPELVALQMIVPYAYSQLDAHTEYLHTGSPHVVQWVADPDAIDVRAEGARLRYHPDFAQQNGTNVNFASRDSKGNLYMRTYERGVEDETYSCGTGVTAAAFLYHQAHPEIAQVQVRTKGGDLHVYFEDGKPWLCGPARSVFSGMWPL